jgi:hypothetical protein
MCGIFGILEILKMVHPLCEGHQHSIHLPSHFVNTCIAHMQLDAVIAVTYCLMVSGETNQFRVRHDIDWLHFATRPSLTSLDDAVASNTYCSVVVVYLNENILISIKEITTELTGITMAHVVHHVFGDSPPNVAIHLCVFLRAT